MTEVAAAPLDRAARLVTLLFMGIVTGVSVLIVVSGEPKPLALRLVIAGVIPAVVLGMGAFAPKGYATAPGRLIIRRRVVPPRIYATRPEPPVRWPMRGIRLWASGGVFGYFGMFWTRRLGRYRAHVTDRARTVLVATAKGPVVISPADPDWFLRPGPTTESNSAP